MDLTKEQTLGTIALLYSLATTCLPVFFLFLFMVAMSRFLVAPLSAGPLVQYIQYLWVLPTIVLVALLVLVLFTYLEYTAYRFALEPYALKIRQGFLNTDEVAIPYNKIQDVDVERPLIFKMFGLSRLVILTAGHDDPREADSSEGILDMLYADVAEAMKAELLKRAEVQIVRPETP